jgi:hypothetical protein
MTNDDFLYRDLPVVNKRVHRLGLAFNYGIDGKGVEAAHPGAETDIFPSYEKRRPLTVAYTATSWRKLLKAPKGWDSAPMTAGDCYRFCLTSPHVDVTLCGPGSVEQLDDNLKALGNGPLTTDEEAWMRRFGAAVHG